jgi:hypothetical protein
VSFLLPSALVFGAIAIIATIAAHFITRSRPRPEPLPTARFVPDRPLRARARTLSLADVGLLMLRLAAIAALAAAVAAPIRTAARGRVLRVIAADQSRAVAAIGEVRDSVRAVARTGDFVLAFDTSASVVSGARLDSLAASRAPGSLSTALTAAIGMAGRATARADSVELVIVSAFASEEMDDATRRIRESWPGRIRLVRVARATRSTDPIRVESLVPSDDPIVAAIALAGFHGAPGSIRLIRGQPSSNDSAWARSADHVLLHWPATRSDASWPARDRVDTVGAVTSTATVVARLPRVWNVDPSAGRPIARWIDGEPAAAERPLGDGCVRDVAILVDPASDLTLRPAFRSFLQGLLTPCGGARSSTPLPAGILDSLRGVGPLVPSSVLRDPHETTSSWTAWLLAVGALLLIVELAARRQRSVDA